MEEISDVDRVNAVDPAGKMRTIPIAVQQDAEQRASRIRKASPWLSSLGRAVDAIVKSRDTHVRRLGKLRMLADRVNAALAPESACSKGCSACCHIRVDMTEWEAGLIAREIGVPAQDVSDLPFTTVQPGDADPIFGTPCGFLKDNECSIYEARPIACRMHHNLAPDARECQLDVDPEDSMVPSMNIAELTRGYMISSGTTMSRDIRAFFPNGKGSGR